MFQEQIDLSTLKTTQIVYLEEATLNPKCA